MLGGERKSVCLPGAKREVNTGEGVTGVHLQDQERGLHSSWRGERILHLLGFGSGLNSNDGSRSIEGNWKCISYVFLKKGGGGFLLKGEEILIRQSV